MNVKDDPEGTDTAAASREVAVTVTSPVGRVASLTVNEAVSPSSTGTTERSSTSAATSSSSTSTRTVAVTVP